MFHVHCTKRVWCVTPLDTNIDIDNLSSGLLHSKECLKKNLLDGPMSQRGTIKTMAGVEDIVEGIRRILQLFEVGGEMVQEKFRAELPGSGITKGFHIL